MMSASPLTSFPCIKVNSSSIETSQASQVKQEEDSGKRHPWLMVKNNSPSVVPEWLIDVKITTGSTRKTVRSNIDSNVKSNVTKVYLEKLQLDTIQMICLRLFLMMTEGFCRNDWLPFQRKPTDVSHSFFFPTLLTHSLMITHGNCKQSRVIITAIVSVLDWRSEGEKQPPKEDNRTRKSEGRIKRAFDAQTVCRAVSSLFIINTNLVEGLKKARNTCVVKQDNLLDRDDSGQHDPQRNEPDSRCWHEGGCHHWVWNH